MFGILYVGLPGDVPNRIRLVTWLKLLLFDQISAVTMWEMAAYMSSGFKADPFAGKKISPVIGAFLRILFLWLSTLSGDEG